MKITCPSCAAEYNTPKPLAAGRIVRCAKCGTEWAPVPAEPIVAEAPEPPPPEPEPPPASEPLARLAPPLPAPPTRQWPLLSAWLASLLAIVAGVAMAFLFRDPFMRAWPPSQRVYGVLGLHAAASPDVHGDVVKEPGR